MDILFKRKICDYLNLIYCVGFRDFDFEEKRIYYFRKDDLTTPRKGINIENELCIIFNFDKKDVIGIFRMWAYENGMNIDKLFEENYYWEEYYGGLNSHAEGCNATASGVVNSEFPSSIASGNYSIAYGSDLHIESYSIALLKTINDKDLVLEFQDG